MTIPLFKRIRNFILPKKAIIFLTGTRCINQAEVLKKIHEMKSPGVSKGERSPSVTVSLTSFPERIDTVVYTIFSLLDQTLKPDRVVLWLSEVDFPEGLRHEELSRLQRYGLEIRLTGENLRSYDKLVHSIEEYPEDIIVTADDDVYYKQDWLEKLYSTYLKNEGAIVCHRAHSVLLDDNHQFVQSYNLWKCNIRDTDVTEDTVLFPTGVGGVLYPPGSLHPDTTNRELFTRLAPTTDDIWFWAMALRAGTRTVIAENNYTELINVDPVTALSLNKKKTLSSINLWEGGNDRFMKAVLDHFDDIGFKAGE